MIPVAGISDIPSYCLILSKILAPFFKPSFLDIVLSKNYWFLSLRKHRTLAITIPTSDFAEYI